MMNNKKLVVSAFFSIIITAILVGIAAFRSIEINNDSELLDLKKYKSHQVSDPYLTAKGLELIELKLLKPLRQKIKIKANAKMYSRCPSGLNHYVEADPSEDSPYFLCVIEHYQGCEGRKVCNFRVNANEEIIEVLDTKTQTYISAEKWLNGQTESTLAANHQHNKSKN